MSKIDQIKIPVTIDATGNMYMDELLATIQPEEPKWKLVRSRDGLTKQSVAVMWIEYGDNGFFKAKHDEPAVGRSLIMSPFNLAYTWQTTAITCIIEHREDYVCFHTANSRYELFRINQ